MSNAWLAGLKPGDEVFVDGVSAYVPVCRCRVERLTATLVAIEGGRRFLLKDGRQLGGGRRWYHTQLLPITDEKAMLRWARAELSEAAHDLSQSVSKMDADTCLHLAQKIREVLGDLKQDNKEQDDDE